jgi:mannose-6-phosphate isomerase-like protein (cupin superfamily)
MEEIKDYIESGILESYVLGLTTEEESREVEEMASNNLEVRKAIDAFSKSLEAQVLVDAVEPRPTVRPMILATFDYLSRMEKGEEASTPPLLQENSRLEDYINWLTRPDMVLPVGAQDFFAKIIGHTPEATTVIAWIKNGAPPEVHTNEYEKFLIVEGTCNITIGQKVHNLAPGDFLAIPLFESHKVEITSAVWCKAILQRVAA